VLLFYVTYLLCRLINIHELLISRHGSASAAAISQLLQQQRQAAAAAES